jgi:hypothetical protein
MYLPDSVFCETQSSDCKAGCGRKLSPLIEFNENVNKLAEILRKSKKPMDYFSISEALGFKYVLQVYSRGVCKNPARARKCVSALLKKYPGQFEIISIEKTNKRGSIYSAPAVRAIPGVDQ